MFVFFAISHLTGRFFACRLTMLRLAEPPNMGQLSALALIFETSSVLAPFLATTPTLTIVANTAQVTTDASQRVRWGYGFIELSCFSLCSACGFAFAGWFQRTRSRKR